MKNLESLVIKSVRTEFINKTVAKELDYKFLTLIYKIDRGIVDPLPIWEKIKDLINPIWDDNRKLLFAMDRIKYPVQELNKTLSILVIIHRMLCPGKNSILWIKNSMEQYAIDGRNLFSVKDSPNGGIPMYEEDGAYHYPIALEALDGLSYRRYYYMGGKDSFHIGIFGREPKEKNILLWLKENRINSLMLDYWYKKALDCLKQFED